MRSIKNFMLTAAAVLGTAALAQAPAPAPAPAPAAPAAAPTQDAAASLLKVYVFPANNQTPDLQAKDSNDCYTWAKQQTGVDPTNPTVPAKADTSQAGKGSAVKGAAKGAAAGAAIGAIAGDTGKGAAIGADRGRHGRRRRQEAGPAAGRGPGQAAAAGGSEPADGRLQEGVHRLHGRKEVHRQVAVARSGEAPDT